MNFDKTKIMKNLVFLLFVLGTSSLSFGQQVMPPVKGDMAEHKIVFQITTADTNVHKMLMRQLGNVLHDGPNTRMEVVCHSPGISMLISSGTIVHAKIKEYTAMGVTFVACENTLREKKLTKDQIIPEAGFVKSGILEIVGKQEQGWSYIRVAE